MDQYDMIALFGSSCWREGSMYSPYIDEAKRPCPNAANKGESNSVLSSTAQSWNIDLDRDVKALISVFGPMESGKTIELSLSELLEICPRKRRKSDAFITLKKQLQKAYGVELRVAPNVKQNEKKKNTRRNC